MFKSIRQEINRRNEIKARMSEARQAADTKWGIANRTDNEAIRLEATEAAKTHEAEIVRLKQSEIRRGNVRAMAW